MTEPQVIPALDPNKAAPTPVETKFDMADVADIVKQAIEEHAPVAMKEAIAPYVEKSATLEKYADAIVELERKKQELNTPPGMKGCAFVRYARLNALGKGNWELGIREAKQRSAWGPDDPTAIAAEKALTASDPSAAGSIIPAVMAAEFIELLRGRTTVRSIARIIPMPQGNLTLRKQTAAATATYTGESTVVNASQQTVGDVVLAFKKLVTITAVSNSLLRFSSGVADEMVRDDLLMVMALKEDLEFITGNAASSTPQGILNRVADANKFDDTGTTYAQQIADYAKAIRLLEDANIPLTSTTGWWIMHPQIFWGIFATTGTTEDATSPFQAGLNLNPPQLLGYPVLKTTQTGASGASTGRIYFCHGPTLLIGDSLNMEVTSFDGASYVDSTGTLVSGASRDESIIRVVSEHDFNMRHDLGASIIETVTVGS
jgi:HK97 family phage major capsid protein